MSSDDEGDALSDKKKGEAKKKQQKMVESKKFKERKKLSSSDEDESVLVKKIKHNKKLNIQFMIKVLHTSEFRNDYFTNLIEGSKQQVQFKSHIVFMCHGAYPEADEDVQKLHLPADVYKMWNVLDIENHTLPKNTLTII